MFSSKLVVTLAAASLLLPLVLAGENGNRELVEELTPEDLFDVDNLPEGESLFEAGMVTDPLDTRTLIVLQGHVKLYGLEDGIGGGIRDMTKLQNVVRKKFNKIQEELGLLGDFEVSDTEVTRQELKQSPGLLRTLQEDGTERRELQLSGQAFLDALLGTVMLCRFCKDDNTDRKLRSREKRVERHLASTSLAHKVFNGLKNSNREFYQNLECVKITWGGQVDKSRGCTDVHGD